ncbi:unnamed protein product [Ranitomeya imitator]|uniref:Uncharacterized protein n=1 Tax=Ranitomeya imitator TaxID=111125 RepID=A0ABN9KRI2_9NEOB|nr:unnamed protein product [Ranitomeya imitator]
MPAPTLIQMEEEIEEELSRGRPNADQKGYPRPQMPARPPRTLCDLKNLDELVREILGCCQCPSQFPMIKVCPKESTRSETSNTTHICTGKAQNVFYKLA